MNFKKLVAAHKIYENKKPLNTKVTFKLLEDIEVHDELNQDLWDKNNELKPEVKDKILEIVKYFKDNLKEDDIELDVKDVVIVGSNCSYNYTKDSDIDIHIVADLSVYKGQEDLASKLYQAYKTLWNNKYSPLIYGHEAEVYVEPDAIHANSNGIYSLKDGWIKTPKKDIIPDVDMDAVNKELQPFIDRYNKVKTIEDIDKLIDDIYILRQQGILEDGEYSIKNLTFKEFRNRGYLQDLKDKRVELVDKELSLESLTESYILLPGIGEWTWVYDLDEDNPVRVYKIGKGYYFPRESLLKLVDSWGKDPTNSAGLAEVSRSWWLSPYYALREDEIEDELRNTTGKYDILPLENYVLDNLPVYKWPMDWAWYEAEEPAEEKDVELESFNNNSITNKKAEKLMQGMVEIPDEFFCGCHELTSITIPNSVTKIGEQAFNRCDSLETIYIENNSPLLDNWDDDWGLDRHLVELIATQPDVELESKHNTLKFNKLDESLLQERYLANHGTIHYEDNEYDMYAHDVRELIDNGFDISIGRGIENGVIDKLTKLGENTEDIFSSAWQDSHDIEFYGKGKLDLSCIKLQKDIELEAMQPLKEDVDVLSLKQEAFFKNSKVRDNRGVLYTCYRGTQAEDRFDSKIVWFTTDRDYAERFKSVYGEDGKLLSCYLACTNIFDVGKVNAKLFNGQEISEEMDHIVTKLELTKDLFEKEFKNELETGVIVLDIINTRKFANIVYRAGYDCIQTIEGDDKLCFGVLDTHLIKATSNKNPTKNGGIND